ncbi:hypothetical protein QWY99_08145 [Flavobacterium branchiarum]|uniref:Uncharacterized protein n=1 Tax=Flavobacterium branchiarum TaxID=1114870 RepID=A0ABV5FSP6_9FLAO|nr:hypothetical protein [Flavobacterium branchiarum]MDN3673020.1 hypothetical protein [Flavobacterium branchiarum]
MKGVVKLVNSQNGLCAIELDNNNFTIFEDFDEGLSVGDVVSGDLESLGGETLYNETQELEVDGFIENFGCGINQIKTQLKLN